MQEVMDKHDDVEETKGRPRHAVTRVCPKKIGPTWSLPKARIHAGENRTRQTSVYFPKEIWRKQRV